MRFFLPLLESTALSLLQILCHSSSPEEAHVCGYVCLRPHWHLAAVLRPCSSRSHAHLPRRVQRWRLHHLWGILVGSRERKACLCVQHPAGHVCPASVSCRCVLSLYYCQTEELRCTGPQDTRPGRCSTSSKEEDLSPGCALGVRLCSVLASYSCIQCAARHWHSPHQQALLFIHPTAVSPVRHELILLQPFPLRVAARPLPRRVTEDVQVPSSYWSTCQSLCCQCGLVIR